MIDVAARTTRPWLSRLQYTGALPTPLIAREVGLAPLVLPPTSRLVSAGKAALLGPGYEDHSRMFSRYPRWKDSRKLSELTTLVPVVRHFPA